MVYILTAQLYDDTIGHAAFDNYRAYLAGPGLALPPGARELANSDWYWSSSDHRAPHDAWLESARVIEAGQTNQRGVTIELQLLGAYHDGRIQFIYHDVRRYRLELNPNDNDVERGHRDWRHDEFRVSTSGRVEHESEWWGRANTGTWLIEAAEVSYQWLPFAGAADK